MNTTLTCPKCGATTEMDATLTHFRRHMLDAHMTPYTFAMAQAMVSAPAPAAVAPAAPVVATPAASAVAAPVVAGTQPLVGKLIAVAGCFPGPYTAERVEEILTAAGAKTTDRRGLNRAMILLAGGRIGTVLDTAVSLGLEVKDLAWLKGIEAQVGPVTAGPVLAPVAPVVASPEPAPVGVVVAAPMVAVAPRPAFPVPNAFKPLVIPFTGSAMVPEATGKYEWMGLDKWLALMVAEKERVCLVGPAGCGKSRAIVEMAALTNHPLIRINLEGQATVQDLLGKPGARNGSTHFEYGALPLAMKNGWWFLADEWDMAEADVLAVLHAVTEDDGVLVLKENGGEVIVPHPDFRFFATGNSLGLHDDSGLYAGTKPMSAALLDRVVVKLMDHNSESKEARILASRGVPLDVAKLICSAGTAIRKLIENGTITGVWTTRRALQFAKYALITGSYEQGFSIAAEGKYTAPEYKAAWDVAQRITGKDVKGVATSAA